jgi:general secretion pathway protein D
VGCAAQQAYEEGRSMLDRGDTGAAITKLQQAAALDPRSATYRLGYLQARERAVAEALRAAETHLSQGRLPEAERAYRQVLALEPGHERAGAALKDIDSQRRHDKQLRAAEDAWARKDAAAALALLKPILIESPSHAQAQTLRRRIAEAIARPALEPRLAEAYRKPLTIEFKDAPLRTVFEVISRTSGLNFVFDKDVRGDQKTTVFLRNTTTDEALQILLLTNQLERRVLDANSLLIYPNTSAKQKDYQPTSVRSFYLANADAKNVANSLKTITKTRDVVVDERLNLVILRDSPDVLRVAEKLVALHDIPEPEVMLEVEILEIKRSRLLDLGVQLPDQLTLTPLPATQGGTLTLDDLRNLNRSRIGASVGAVTFNAAKIDGDTNILANPRIRVRNREKAKVLIGERVPNISTTATSTGFISESVTYVDVGLKLDVEPVIYPEDEVVMKVSLEVSNIVSQIQTKSGTLAYQIGTRTASTVLRLRDGENQVLAGLINDEDRRTARKFPGLGDIPVIGRLFGSHADDNTKTEIVLSITPRVLRNIPKRYADEMEFEAGTESNLGQRSVALASSGLPSPAAIAPAGSIGNAPAAPATATPSPATAAAPVSALPSSVGRAATLSWQGATQGQAGEPLTVQLMLQSAEPLANVPLTVTFDPRVLQVVGVQEGDFLRQGGVPATFSSRVDSSGSINIAAARSGGTGAAGSGSLATLTLRPLVPSAQAALQVSAPTVLRPDGQAASVQLPPPHVISIEP